MPFYMHTNLPDAGVLLNVLGPRVTTLGLLQDPRVPIPAVVGFPVGLLEGNAEGLPVGLGV